MQEQREAEEELAVLMNQRLVKEVRLLQSSPPSRKRKLRKMIHQAIPTTRAAVCTIASSHDRHGYRPRTRLGFCRPEHQDLF